jgi:segregation and condensation protein A
MTDSASAQPSADPTPDTVAAGRDPGGGPPSDDSTDDTDDVEPVEVLVQLAEEGEIDPWDVDLVAATDAFLDRLEETDLRTSGRALRSLGGD